MANSIAFFAEHAGFSWDPKTETPAQGAAKCAEALAKAEAWLASQPGHQIEWRQDDNDDRSGIEHDGPLFGCIVTLADGRSESLCGIDLGANGDLGDPYTRVVVAELASELMA